MLLRFAKLAGGLRLLITETAPLVGTSISVLGARAAAYLVGFGLGSIASVWLPIVSVLISITGLFGLFSDSSECESYRAQIAEIDAANLLLLKEYENARKPLDAQASQEEQILQDYYNNNPPDYSICPTLDPEKWKDIILEVEKDFEERVSYWNDLPLELRISHPFPVLSYPTHPEITCRNTINDQIKYNSPQFPPIDYPPLPILQSYPCSGGSGAGPDCPAGKKVWLQVIWGSPAGNFSDSKGCFLIGYSQDAPDLPVEIEYNPFLPEEFIKSRPLFYYSVKGDRFRELNDSKWKNLESVQGWDKGYWIAESVDPECRGWHPGWSRKIK